jgi:hypothetical protein
MVLRFPRNCEQHGVGSPSAAPSASWRLVGTGDVKSDILWQNSGGEVRIWELNRTSIASAVAPGNPGAAWQLQGASDVNGDGKDDLLFMNPITDQAQTWLMNGTQVASMQAPVSVPAAAQPAPRCCRKWRPPSV